MWKVEFFILPSNNYHALTENEVFEFGEKVEYLDSSEKLYVPDEFYDRKDQNNITALDFLYGNEQNDLSDYLLEIISKQKTCSDTYDEISTKMEYGYLPISRRDWNEKIAHICVQSIKDEECDKYLIVNDVIQIKRFYLKKAKDYKILIERVEECFPNIVFHNDAFKYVEKLGKCADVVDELIRHLTILNDVGNKLYTYHNKNEKATLEELKSSYHLECSGKGSNERKSYNKDFTYNNKKYQLTCNPHTKLYKKRSDKRIYFCWGRDEIENHSMIVVRIGDHW